MPTPVLPDPELIISNKVARRFLLSHQFLWPPRNLKGKQGIHTLFQRLGSIQYDTINTVGRNADLVLQSRISNHTPNLLAEMLYSDRSLVDGWDKMASIYPIKDWHYFSRHRQVEYHFNPERIKPVKNNTSAILKELQQRGPLSSLDFPNQEKINWSWGNTTSFARAALEYLHSTGKIGIHDKVGTRRIFDLVERLVPAQILSKPEPHTETETYHDWHILRRIGSMGLASLKAGEYWLGIRGAKAPERRAAIIRLAEAGKIIPIAVEDIQETFFIRAADTDILDGVRKGRQPAPKAAFLAPLDNFMWNRKMIHDLFNFTYIWEVYKPKVKREYGYYILPVLYGDQLVARVEPKFDRKTQELWINNWWWEDSVKIDDRMKSALSRCVKSFKKYLGAKAVILGPNLPKKKYSFLLE